MISWRLSAWRKLVALAPLLLLAAYLPGQMMLRCRIDGRLRAACCCPHEQGHGDGGESQATGPVVKAQDCCDQELTISQRSAAAPARASGSGGDADILRTLSLAVTLPALDLYFAETDRSDRLSSRLEQAHAPPGDGPPIVLLKHAFLI